MFDELKVNYKPNEVNEPKKNSGSNRLRFLTSLISY